MYLTRNFIILFNTSLETDSPKLIYPVKSWEVVNPEAAAPTVQQRRPDLYPSTVMDDIIRSRLPDSVLFSFKTRMSVCAVSRAPANRQSERGVTNPRLTSLVR